MESQNHLGWKKPVRSSSWTIYSAVPHPPLKYVPKCHIPVCFKYIQGSEPLWVKFPWPVALGTRAHHTQSMGGWCPQQEGQVVRGKQTADFLGCLWAFWLTGTSPEKGIRAEHGLPNERWLWNTRVFDLEGALLHEEWDLALPARTAFSVRIFSKLLLPIFSAPTARYWVSLSDVRRVGEVLCVTPVVSTLQGPEPESHSFFRVCFLWNLMEISSGNRSWF